MNTRLVPPCGYKGGKRRWSQEIAQHVLASNPQLVYDIGAGSAAVSLSLVEAGLPPSQLVLVEAGPWGAYWKAAVTGKLDFERIERLFFRELPDDPRKVKAWIESVADTGDTSPEVFLLLSAAAYGSVGVWHDGTDWRRGDAGSSRGYSARSYWEPGPNSRETKPRGTIFTPEKIVERARASASALCGATVIHGLAEDVEYLPATMYIDPPYVGVSGYGFAMDMPTLLEKAKGPVFCSEQTVQNSPDRVINLGQRKGGALHAGAKSQKELLLAWGARSLLKNHAGEPDCSIVFFDDDGREMMP
jgi:hypothetical protein